jgi:REP element-mobilizing transposase RayT
MRAECTRLGVELLALGGTENHVHVLVEIPSSVSVAALVKQLKGVSSHLVTHGSGESSPFKWQGGYGAFTLSGDDIPACRRYIEDQERHHGTGEFDPERELARRWRPE